MSVGSSELLRVIGFFVSSIEWIANLFIVIITIYGFYVAFLSKRISVVSLYKNFGKAGENYIILLKNHAL